MSDPYDTRFCIDCRFFGLAPGRWLDEDPTKPPRCMKFARRVVSSTNPVWGEAAHFSAPECVAARGEGGQCGAGGRHFEASYGERPERKSFVIVKDDDLAKTEWVSTGTRPWWKFW